MILCHTCMKSTIQSPSVIGDSSNNCRIVRVIGTQSEDTKMDRFMGGRDRNTTNRQTAEASIQSNTGFLDFLGLIIGILVLEGTFSNFLLEDII